MKDELMLGFYKQQTSFDADSFTKWREWCVDHGERHGSYSEFMGRLKRCHLAQLRLKPARHGTTPCTRIGSQ
jgi:hypothetical protein